MRKETGNPIELLPDDLGNLRHYNLLSYKSLREPFDDWALKELTGHYVNYRKQISPSFQNLFPEEEFQLYGVLSTDEILKRFSLEEIQKYLEKEQKQSRAIAPQKMKRISVFCFRLSTGNSTIVGWRVSAAIPHFSVLTIRLTRKY